MDTGREGLESDGEIKRKGVRYPQRLAGDNREDRGG